MENSNDAIDKNYSKYREDIRKIVQKIHDTPELSEEETLACKWQAELLEKWGFEVETKYKGLDTAFNATSGKKGLNICIMSEYDALPGIGHGYGHLRHQ